MKTILLIIDMQKKWEEAFCPKIVRAINKQIGFAKRYKWSIYVVEYSGCGKTNKKIINNLPKNRVKFIKKRKEDGSDKIVSFVKNKKIDIIRVTGIFSFCCVEKTTIGLHDKLNESIKYKIIKKGCDKENLLWAKSFKRMKII